MTNLPNSVPHDRMEWSERMSIKDAKAYINYGIKEGHFSPEDFEGMSDEEMIAFADKASAKADAQMEMARDIAEELYREEGII